MSKEQSLVTKVMKLFSKDEIYVQCSVSRKRADMYFLEHN